MTGATIHLVRVVDFPSTSYTYVYGAMIESEAIAVQLEDALALAGDYLTEVARGLTRSCSPPCTPATSS